MLHSRLALSMGRIQGGFKSIEERKAFSRNAVALYVMFSGGLQSAITFFIIHGKAIHLLDFKNPFTKLQNLINICIL